MYFCKFILGLALHINKSIVIMTQDKNSLFEHITQKSLLKLQVNEHTRSTFEALKAAAQNLSHDYQTQSAAQKVTFRFKDRSPFEFEIQFGGDTLVFLLHSNTYEIPRNHSMMRKPYIDEDKDRRFCGMISIYNFLTDSFTYHRENDGGFMIGRLLINKDKHFFIEGKKELAMVYHQFENAVIDETTVSNILQASIAFTLNFDLLIPPYDQVAYVAVADIKENMQKGIATNKRMGFKFGEDKIAKKGDDDLQ